jgi:polyhydroxybutyrate depolymerase
MLATGLGIIDGPTLWRQASGHISVEAIAQGSLSREFRVFRPAGMARRPGLVLVLHGADASGEQIERQSGFDAQAERLGWIAAYPDGYADGWEPFGCCHHEGVDDVAFMGAIIDRLSASDSVDPNQVYVTGISRGGMMAYRLACEMSSRLAAIAPVAGNMADSTGNVHNVDCRPDRPVSILALHGSDDPEIPITGGRSRVVQEEVSYASLAAVIQTWRGLDGCASQEMASAQGAIAESRWGCSRGTEVEVLVLKGAGHAWPGAPIVNAPWSPGSSLDASRTIADFFAAHARAER